MRSAPQSAVSLKLKRLEAHLGKPLLARTPRVVKLAADGENFLPAARALLDAHDHALGAISAGTHRLSLGVSEHVAVPDLPAVLTSLHRQDPGLSLEMHLGTSTNLLAQYDERRFDAVIVRHEPGEDPLREDGTLLFSEPLAWLAAPDWVPRAGEPLPLAVLAGPCGVRAAALRALDHAGRPWRERFTGGGVAAVTAAAAAGPSSARWRGSRRARWSTSARNSGCRRCRCRRSCCIRGYATHVPAPRCAGLPTALQSRRKLTGFAARNLRRIPMTPDARKHLRANLLMLAAAAIWGSAFVAQRLSLDVIGPFLFTGPFPARRAGAGAAADAERGVAHATRGDPP